MDISLTTPAGDDLGVGDGGEVDSGADASPDLTVVPTVPGAPTGVSASSGSGSASVTWLAPANDGGRAITLYTVTSNPGGITTTVGGQTLMATVNGLTNGTTYTFTVAATNSLGMGPASSPSNGVTPTSTPVAPDAPTGVTASANLSLGATVSWTAPDNHGSPISGYTVVANPGGVTVTTSDAGTSTPVNGLTAGTSYTFTVKATNGVGTGAASAASNAIVVGTVPSAPSIGTATAKSGFTALVTWTPPASDPNHPILDYTATSTPGGLTATIGGSNQVDGVWSNADVSYTFTVTARNDLGSSSPSSASGAIIAGDHPPTPTIGTATALAGHTARGTWNPPASNANHPILDYTATSSPGGFTGTATGASANQVNVTGLADGVSYTFTVTARNDLGSSFASGASNSIVSGDVPAAPQESPPTCPAPARSTSPSAAPAAPARTTCTTRPRRG